VVSISSFVADFFPQQQPRRKATSMETTPARMIMKMAKPVYSESELSSSNVK
jgi:hypothetical protein